MLNTSHLFKQKLLNMFKKIKYFIRKTSLSATIDKKYRFKSYLKFSFFSYFHLLKGNKYIFFEHLYCIKNN
jgi:hypothetical protein